jgi:hypothetical protein
MNLVPTGPRIFITLSGSGIERAAQSSDGSWLVTSLLSGADVRCLAADPLNPRVVYAGSNQQGLLRSTDGGATWLPAGLAGIAIRSVAVSPSRSGILCVGTKPPGLFISHDHGATWQDLAGLRKRRQWWWFTPAEPGAAYTQAVALSPTDPNVILAGIELGAVLRSEDCGMTWSSHRQGALRDCHTLAFHVNDGRWAYEGGGTGAGAAISRDGGETWVQPRQGLDRHYGWAVAADPARPEIWYAAIAPSPFKAHGSGNAEACIFRSEGGAIWEKIAGPLAAMPYALITDPALPAHLFAGLRDGTVMQSANYGDTWERMPFKFGQIQRTVIMVCHQLG